MRPSLVERPGAASLVVDLAMPAALDPAVAGGKGAALARLARAGFPTLPGAVVTTAAFRAAGGRAPGRVPGLGTALRRQVAHLGSGPYAVRSSAVDEDGRAASWAGILRTQLAVPASGVLGAVAAVWRSASSPRARRYARRAAPVVAVVVQPMGRALAAGTCFTASPGGARTPLLVVEAVSGLGAPLVGGRVTPDRYLVDRRTALVLESRPARQRSRLVAGPAGLAWRRLAPAAAAAPKLAPAALRRLARLGLAVERRFGGPQDIEWILTSEGLALLQARPLAVGQRPGGVS